MLMVESEKVPLQDLQHIVNKFVYHRDLNNTHWVSVEGSTVKINKFKVIEKKEKHEIRTPAPNCNAKLGIIAKMH